MIEEDSLVSGQNQNNEDVLMKSVRPDSLSNYIGQADVKSQMSLFIKAASVLLSRPFCFLSIPYLNFASTTLSCNVLITRSAG